MTFTDDDQLNPVYCIGCRQQTPRAVSNANRGLCAACVAKLATPTPPPPQAAAPQVAAQGWQINPVSAPRPPAKPTSYFGLAVVAIVVFGAWLFNLVESDKTPKPEPSAAPSVASTAPMPAPQASQSSREAQMRTHMILQAEAAIRTKYPAALIHTDQAVDTEAKSNAAMGDYHIYTVGGTVQASGDPTSASHHWHCGFNVADDGATVTYLWRIDDDPSLDVYGWLDEPKPAFWIK